MALAVVGALVAVGLLIWVADRLAQQYAKERLIERLAPEIAASTQARKEVFSLTIDRFRQEARMIADTPAVQNFASTLIGSGESHIDAKEWAEKLLRAHIDNRPEVLQLRLIEVDARGTERLRYQRDKPGGAVQEVGTLQAKGDRDYVKAGIKLASGAVYVSPLDLNREFGKVQLPPVPTLRVVAPVFLPDGQRAALIVINLDAGNMLRAIGQQVTSGREIYLTNEAGDFLFHPDASRSFGFDLGERFRWQGEYTPVATAQNFQAAGLEAFVSVDDRHHFVRLPIHLGDLDQPSQTLTLAQGISDATVETQLGETRRTVVLAVLFVLAIVGVLVGLIQVWQRRYSVQRGQLAAIVSQSNDAIIGIDLRGRVTEWNEAAERLFGFCAREAQGRSVVGLIVPEEHASEEQEILQRVSAGEVVPHFESQRRHKDGSLLDVSVTVSPVRGPQGQIVGAAKILRDISRQIEDQHRREQLLAEQSELSRGVIDSSSQAILVVDEQGVITQANRRVEGIFGYSPADLIGGGVDQLLPEARRIKHREQRASYDRSSRQMGARRNLTALRASGREFPVEVHLSPLVLGGRRLVVAAVEDVTDRLADLARLRQSEARWRQLADSMPQLVWTCTGDGSCDFLSAQWVSYTGIPEAEQLGAKWLLQVHPEDQKVLSTHWQRAVEARGSFAIEFRIRRHDGVYRWFDTRAEPLFNSEGEIDRWIGSNTDIDDRRQAEEQLRQLNANLEDLVAQRSRHVSDLSERLSIATRSVGMGVWDWDIPTNQLIWDEQMYLLYFMPPENKSEREPYSVWSSRIHPDDRARTEDLLRAAVAGEREYVTEFRVVGPTGESRYISAAALVVRGGDGQALRMVGVNRDTTAMHEAEVALRAAKAEAEQASLAKSAFLANMSHEIRTPMNAVMNLCYLLEQTELSTEQEDLTGKMRIASRSLLGLINDILDLSKIEAGQMGLADEVFGLRGLIDEQMKLMQVQATAKRLDLRAKLPKELPAYVRGDSLRLGQILTNLMSNAIKFTDRGQVSLRIARQDLAADRVRLRFEVEDSGVGITPEAQALLFAPFEQGDQSTTRRFGGTGLGLAIVKRLVDLMGGTLGLESRPGKGSRFWFELEFVVDREGTFAADSPLALDTLVVDDNPEQRERLRESCRALGWRVEAVASGSEAVVRVADRLQSQRPFDAMIVDWLMPEMDGLETIQRLSQLHGTASPAAILLVTAGDHQSLRQLPGAVVADAVLGLPMDPSTLFNAVHQAVARNTGSVGRVTSASPSSPGKGQRLPGVRILLVDDSSVNLDVGQRILEREGARVIVATDGAQAVDIARLEWATLDIVLMDVQMPVMDGMESSRRIRSELGAEVPILAVTAGALVTQRQRAMEAGMNDFVTKPFDAENLILRIREHVERKRGAMLPVAAVERVAVVKPATEIRGLRIDLAMDRVGGDEKLLKSLLRRLLDEFSDFGRDPVSDDARAMVAQQAHKLRGIAGNVGAERIQQLAAELEACARNPQCQQLETLIGAIRVALADLKAASADWLSSAVATSEAGASTTGDQGLDVAALDTLRLQLRQNNLNALDGLEALAAPLRQRLGDEDFGQLTKAMESLRFAEAMQILQRVDGLP